MRPQDRRYRDTHEWVRVEGGEALVGITDYAVEHLSDLVYIQLPRVGQRLKAGEALGEIESVKAVSEIYTPVGGEVLAVNAGLADALDTLARDPFGAGWLVRLRLTDPGQVTGLLTAEQYAAGLGDA